MARKRLGEILVGAGVLDEGRLRAALAEQRRWGGPLGRILVDMGGITEEAMVQALSHQLNFPTVMLDDKNVPLDVIDLVPGELAEQYSVIPFAVQAKFLDVAMADPTNLGIIDELRIRTRLNVRAYLAGPKMIERALAKYYGKGMATLTFGNRGISANDPAVGGDPSVPHNTRMLDDSMGQAPAAARAPARTTSTPPPAAINPGERDREIAALQTRVQHLEALVARDEDVLRKLLGLLIEKGLATREEVLERISS